MCEVLGSVAATGAEVDEDQENPEVLFTGRSRRLRLLFFGFTSRNSYLFNFSASLGSSLGL
jgi:hypothetical protein